LFLRSSFSALDVRATLVELDQIPLAAEVAVVELVV
jgi:hypothetical protein